LVDLSAHRTKLKADQKTDQSGPGDATSIRVRVRGRDYVSNGIYNAYDITHSREDSRTMVLYSLNGVHYVYEAAIRDPLKYEFRSRSRS